MCEPCDWFPRVALKKRGDLTRPNRTAMEQFYVSKLSPIMTSHPICLNFGNVVSRSPDAIVYLEYNPRLLPDKPSGNDEKWTRFVCLSDTHSRSFDVPDGDVLLHGGDLTDLGTVKEFEKVTKWLYSLPHGAKMWVSFLLSRSCLSRLPRKE